MRKRYKEKDVEIFLTIRNFPDYKISNWGRVFSKKRNTFINGRPNALGYYQVALRDVNGKEVWVLIHRLVAEYFVPNICFGTEVDHINKDRTDNRASNLRWVSRKENMQNVPKERMKRGVIQPVVQYDLEGNFIKEYSSAAEAARENGYRADVICWCCRGKLKTAYGFVWRRRLKEQQS